MLVVARTLAVINRSLGVGGWRRHGGGFGDKRSRVTRCFLLINVLP